jgi:hypothetical protein
MLASQVSQWLFIAAVGSAIVVSVLRLLALFMGLKLALKDAPKADRLPMYREFARALSLKEHRDARSSGSVQSSSRDAIANDEIIS